MITVRLEVNEIEELRSAIKSAIEGNYDTEYDIGTPEELLTAAESIIPQIDETFRNISGTALTDVVSESNVKLATAYFINECRVNDNVDPIGGLIDETEDVIDLNLEDLQLDVFFDSNEISAINNFINSVDSTNADILNDFDDSLIGATIVDMLFKRNSDGSAPELAGAIAGATQTIASTPANAAAVENWTINSTDQLILSATHFAPSTDSDNWAILVHGYGFDQHQVYDLADEYLSQGYHVLTPDMRASGQSEGQYQTMGIKESEDVALWTQEVVSENGNANITLQGISTGAAAVLMAAARSDAVNVTEVIGDQNYTNAYDMIASKIEEILGLPIEPTMTYINEASKNVIGFELSDTAPINMIAELNDEMDDSFVSLELDADSSIIEVTDSTITISSVEDMSVVNIYQLPSDTANTAEIDSNVSASASLAVVAGDVGDTLTNNNTSAHVTLIGGTGDDLISAINGNEIDLSGGNDTITLSHFNNSRGGAVIDMGDGITRGSATVQGFDNGFNDTLDSLRISSNDSLSVDWVDDNLRLTNGNTKLVFDSLNGSDIKILIDDGSKTRYNFVNSDSTVSVANKNDEAAEYYGKTHDEGNPNGTVVDFSNYEQELHINMADTTTSSIDHFHNIDKLIGGAGRTYLAGNDNMNTLQAGSGATSIYGAGGRDLMIGYSGSNKTGSTTFFYTADNDMSTITNFEFGTNNTSDKIDTFGYNIAGATVENNALKVQVGNSYDDQVIINNAKNQIMQVNDMVVEVGDELTYDRNVTFYAGLDTDEAEISVSSTTSLSNVEIWINGWDNKAYYNIKNINASIYSGETRLAGNDFDNVLMASSGNSSLWGGAGNDTLYGGAGTDNFYYLKGEGNDVITNVDSNDIINIWRIGYEDLSSADISSDEITVNFTDGGSVKIIGSADVTFKLDNSTSWTADRTNKTWNEK